MVTRETLSGDSATVFADARVAHAHLVGVGGAGMSALARLLQGVGVPVTGSDATASPTLAALQSEGLTVWPGAQPKRIDAHAGWVVRSAAVPEDDPEVRACADRGFESMLYAEALGRLSRQLSTLAVAGAHGKTTTVGMLAAALLGGGVDASFLVGGELPTLGGNGHGGRSEWLAVEACEFNRSFHQLAPRAAAILNVDHDHFDCYPTAADLDAAFAGFAARVQPNGLLVVHEDVTDAVLRDLDPSVEVLRFGFGSAADVRPEALREVGGSYTFAPHVRGAPLLGPDGEVEVTMHLPGRFQVGNALCALALAQWAGAEAGGAGAAVGSFEGVRRRFELRASPRGVEVIDDYAHHPAELDAVAAAARGRFPGRRLLAVFQPHQHRRTAALIDGFARSLAAFDFCLVVDIYPAREGPQERKCASVDDLVRAVRGAGGCCDPAGGLGGLADRVRAEYRDGDVVLLLGAGDLEQVVDDVVALL